MIIGVPKEIKDHEARVGVTPAAAKALTEAGHTVLVETHAGAQSPSLLQTCCSRPSARSTGVSPGARANIKETAILRMSVDTFLR